MSTGKGKKRVKNIPVLYDERKNRHTVLLTDTAWHKLQYIAELKGLSASEMIEQWIREIDGE